MTSRRWRLALVALTAVLAGLVVAVGIDIVRVGGLDVWLAKIRQGPPYQALGRVVDVPGGGLYLDCRGSGTPTVILEGGAGAGADSWGTFLDAVARATRVCAWDRPGIGRSAARPVHTMGETAAALQRLLDLSGEGGPYILVAHSFGGVYARLFAARHRLDGRVIALLQLDSYEPDLGVANDLALPAGARAEIQQSLDSTAQALAGGETLDWAASMAELAAAGPVTTPAIRLSKDPAGKYADRNPELRAALLAAEDRGLARIYPNGTLEVVPGAGHFIYLDRPDVVVERVRELANRSRQP